MKFLLKRSSILILLLLALISVGCGSKNVPLPPGAGGAPPPPSPSRPLVGPPPTITLRADNTTITAGQSATLTYSSTNASTVTIQPGVGPVEPTTGGSRQVTPTAATTYTATATGPGGTASSSGVTITVDAVRPPTTTTAAPPAAPTTANRGGGLEVIFSQQMVPILFDYDKANINSTEEPKLLAEAAWLKQNASVRFTVEGHADERGGQEYNIALGDERAAAVKKYLAAQGIAENRMTTVSYGEERPVCSVMSEDCWQRNRRAAFVRVP